MTTITASNEPGQAETLRRERGNVLRLAICQALAGANSTVVYATGAVVGDMLAPSKALATMPISIFVVGMALCTLPAGAVAQRHGRRAAFMLGTGCGVLAGLLGALAVAHFPERRGTSLAPRLPGGPGLCRP